MKFPAVLWFSLLFGSGFAQALDLTPNESWRQLEGFRVNILVFKDTKGNVRYQPPADWNVTGGANLLSLRPEKQGTFMQFRLVSRGKAELVTGAASEALSQWTRTFLPPDAVEVALSEERPSPFTLGARPSREYIYTYKAGGQRFMTAIAVCDLNDHERFVVNITAHQADFAEAHETGIASLFSWTWRD